MTVPSIHRPPVTGLIENLDVGDVLDSPRAGRWDALAGLSGERPLLAGAPTGAA